MNPIVGNEYTGEIKADRLKKVGARITRIQGHWVDGTMGDLEFNAKIYSELPEDTSYGIRGSRISKLAIKYSSKTWMNPLYSWDRGLDEDQDNQEANLLRSALIAAVAL